MLYVKSTGILNPIVRRIDIPVLFVNPIDLRPVLEQTVIVSS
jgi:hypothetical protein